MSRSVGFVTDNDGSDPRICGGDWGCRVQKHEPIWGSRTYKSYSPKCGPVASSPGHGR